MTLNTENKCAGTGTPHHQYRCSKAVNWRLATRISLAGQEIYICSKCLLCFNIVLF